MNSTNYVKVNFTQLIEANAERFFQDKDNSQEFKNLYCPIELNPGEDFVASDQNVEPLDGFFVKTKVANILGYIRSGKMFNFQVENVERMMDDLSGLWNRLFGGVLDETLTQQIENLPDADKTGTPSREKLQVFAKRSLYWLVLLTRGENDFMVRISKDPPDPEDQSKEVKALRKEFSARRKVFESIKKITFYRKEVPKPPSPPPVQHQVGPVVRNDEPRRGPGGGGRRSRPVVDNSGRGGRGGRSGGRGGRSGGRGGRSGGRGTPDRSSRTPTPVDRYNVGVKSPSPIHQSSITNRAAFFNGGTMLATIRDEDNSPSLPIVDFTTKELYYMAELKMFYNSVTGKPEIFRCIPPVEISTKLYRYCPIHSGRGNRSFPRISPSTAEGMIDAYAYFTSNGSCYDKCHVYVKIPIHEDEYEFILARIKNFYDLTNDFSANVDKTFKLNNHARVVQDEVTVLKRDLEFARQNRDEYTPSTVCSLFLREFLKMDTYVGKMSIGRKTKSSDGDGGIKFSSLNIVRPKFGSPSFNSTHSVIEKVYEDTHEYFICPFETVRVESLERKKITINAKISVLESKVSELRTQIENEDRDFKIHTMNRELSKHENSIEELRERLESIERDLEAEVDIPLFNGVSVTVDEDVDAEDFADFEFATVNVDDDTKVFLYVGSEMKLLNIHPSSIPTILDIFGVETVEKLRSLNVTRVVLEKRPKRSIRNAREINSFETDAYNSGMSYLRHANYADVRSFGDENIDDSYENMGVIPYETCIEVGSTMIGMYDFMTMLSNDSELPTGITFSGTKNLGFDLHPVRTNEVVRLHGMSMYKVTGMCRVKIRQIDDDEEEDDEGGDELYEEYSSYYDGENSDSKFKEVFYIPVEKYEGFVNACRGEMNICTMAYIPIIKENLKFFYRRFVFDEGEPYINPLPLINVDEPGNSLTVKNTILWCMIMGATVVYNGEMINFEENATSYSISNMGKSPTGSINMDDVKYCRKLVSMVGRVIDIDHKIIVAKHRMIFDAGSAMFSSMFYGVDLFRNGINKTKDTSSKDVTMQLSYAVQIINRKMQAIEELTALREIIRESFSYVDTVDGDSVEATFAGKVAGAILYAPDVTQTYRDKLTIPECPLYTLDETARRMCVELIDDERISLLDGSFGDHRFSDEYGNLDDYHPTVLNDDVFVSAFIRLFGSEHVTIKDVVPPIISMLHRIDSKVLEQRADREYLEAYMEFSYEPYQKIARTCAAFELCKRYRQTFQGTREEEIDTLLSTLSKLYDEYVTLRLTGARPREINNKAGEINEALHIINAAAHEFDANVADVLLGHFDDGDQPGVPKVVLNCIDFSFIGMLCIRRAKARVFVSNCLTNVKLQRFRRNNDEDDIETYEEILVNMRPDHVSTFFISVDRNIHDCCQFMEYGSTIPKLSSEKSFLPLRDRLDFITNLLMKMSFDSEIVKRTAISVISNIILNRDPEFFESRYYPDYSKTRYEISPMVENNMNRSYNGTEVLAELKTSQLAVYDFGMRHSSYIKDVIELDKKYSLKVSTWEQNVRNEKSSKDNIVGTISGTTSVIGILSRAYQTVRDDNNIHEKLTKLKMTIDRIMSQLSRIEMTEIDILKVIYSFNLEIYTVRCETLNVLMKSEISLNNISDYFNEASVELSDLLIESHETIDDKKEQIIREFVESEHRDGNTFYSYNEDSTFESNRTIVHSVRNLTKLVIKLKFLNFIRGKYDTIESKIAKHLFAPCKIEDQDKLPGYGGGIINGRFGSLTSRHVDISAQSFMNRKIIQIEEMMEKVKIAMTAIEPGPTRHFLSDIADIMLSIRNNGENNELTTTFNTLKRKLKGLGLDVSITNKTTFLDFLSILNGSFSRFNFFVDEVKPTLDLAREDAHRDKITKYRRITFNLMDRFVRLVCDTTDFDQETLKDKCDEFSKEELIQIRDAFAEHVDEYVGKLNGEKMMDIRKSKESGTISGGQMYDDLNQYVGLNPDLINKLRRSRYKLKTRGSNMTNLFISLHNFLYIKLNNMSVSLRNNILEMYGVYIVNLNSSFNDFIHTEHYIGKRLKIM